MKLDQFRNFINASETLIVPNPLTFSGNVTMTGVVQKGKESIATIAATRTILASESGKIFFFGHSTEFVMTLPLPAAGLNYKFICTAAPNGAAYTIVSAASANIIRGEILSCDLNASSDSDSEASGGDTITFTDGVAVVGDKVELVSDGTNWYAYGCCATYNGIAISTAG